MIVSMDNHYTLNNQTFTVLTVTKAGECCVLGHTPDGQAHEFRADGTTRHGYHVNHSLVEMIPYAEFNIDDKVMVRDSEDGYWQRAYFAGVTHTGIPQTWSRDRTGWVCRNNEVMLWNYCRKPTSAELSELGDFT